MMAIYVTGDGVKKLIKQKSRRAGSLRALAREWDVSVSYLSCILSGKQSPGPKVLDRLRLKRADVYDFEEKTSELGERLAAKGGGAR